MKRPDLPLISYLEIGESATLAREVAASIASDPLLMVPTLTFISHHPEVLHIDAAGRITGRTTGTATVSVTLPGDGQELVADFDITVLPRETTEMPIRSEHPRIRYTASELEERKRLIDGGTLHGLGIDLAAHFASFIARADEFVEKSSIDIVFEIMDERFSLILPHPVQQPTPLPQPVGFVDYPFWTKLSREIERRLTTLAMAWSLTGKPVYADRGKELLLAISGWDKWHEYDKATNNLSLPHLTTGAAIAYDELYGCLTEDERAKVRAAILDLGLRPMSYWFNRNLDHNITGLNNAGMVMGALAIGGGMPFTGKYLSMPLRGLRWYVQQRETSTTTEGLLYTSYAMDCIFKAATAIRRSTGNDELLQSPFIRETLPDLYLYLRGGSGGYANLSDARHEVDDAGPLMMNLVSEFSDPRAAWVVHKDARESPDIFPYIGRDTPVPDLAHMDLPFSRHFERFDWVALRSGWEDHDTLLAFTASPSDVGHNHYDQNHFILNVAGEWLITDPGYQNYSPGTENVFTNATIGHNSLLVNGEGQLVRGKAHVAKTHLVDGFDYACGDATATYEGRIRRWHRHIAFVKPDSIVIIDDLVPTNADDRLALLFHTLGQIMLAGEPFSVGCSADDPSGSSFALHGETSSVALQFFATTGFKVTHEVFPGAERYGTYLRVEPEPGTEQSTVITLLQPRPAGAFLARDGDSLLLTVEHGDRRDEHVFTPPTADDLAPGRYVFTASTAGAEIGEVIRKEGP